MGVVGFLFELAIWNWLGGLVAGLIPLGPIVFLALKRAERSGRPQSVRTYLRLLATNHIWNHAVTVFGSFVITVAAADSGVWPWLAWIVFAIYFFCFRLTHIIDAAVRFIRADALPIASSM